MKQIDADLKEAETKAGGLTAWALSFLDDWRKVQSQRIGQQCVAEFVPSALPLAGAEDRMAMTEAVGRAAFALAAYPRGPWPLPGEGSRSYRPPTWPKSPGIFSTTTRNCTTAGKARAIVLYSVGVNGKDDGGRGYYDRNPEEPADQCDDIVVRVPIDK